MSKMRILLAVIPVMVLGCSPVRRQAGCQDRQFTDDLGRQVMVPAKVGRVISFAPSLTEMIYALGAGDKLAGVTSWCNWPPQAKEKCLVGDMASPNYERMVSLKPDLVVMIGARPGPVLEKLEALKLPVLVFRDESFEDISRAVAMLGQVLDRRRQADSLNSAFVRQLDALRTLVEQVEPGRRPRVFAEIGSNPLFTAGDQSFIGQMIGAAGGRNIAGDMGDFYAAINPEKVVRENPDIILVLHPGNTGQQVAKRIGWQGVSAVRNGRIYDKMDQDIVLRPGPRFVEGLALLHGIFYR